jgi:DNA-binding NarL/FixJ family response regulator
MTSLAMIPKAFLPAYPLLIRRGHVHGAIWAPREESVIKLIAEGHGNKEIADVLSISLKTVESHRAAAMRKLKLSSTADLVRYAIRNKLVEL